MHGSVKQRYSHFWTWKDWSAIPSASPYLESMAPGGPGTGSGLRWRPPGLRFMMANIAATSATIIHPQHPRVAGLVGWLAGWIGSCLRAASACGPGFLEKNLFLLCGCGGGPNKEPLGGRSRTSDTEVLGRCQWDPYGVIVLVGSIYQWARRVAGCIARGGGGALRQGGRAVFPRRVQVRLRLASRLLSPFRPGQSLFFLLLRYQRSSLHYLA
jgi:hypothetical protein